MLYLLAMVSAFNLLNINFVTTLINFRALFCVFFTGVWDVMSNVEVIDFIRQRIATEMNPGEVGNYLLSSGAMHSGHGLY